MNSIKHSLMAGMVVLAAVSAAPALADHDHDGNNWNGHGNNWNGHGNGNGHGNNWNGHNDNNWDRRDINVRVADPRYDDHNDRHYRHQQAAQAAQWSNNWNGQRTLYRNNWNRISRDRQAQLDAQMKAQWMAYHHNNWNGNYSWNTYNDPQFLDYLHTSNPGLLGTLRNALGL